MDPQCKALFPPGVVFKFSATDRSDVEVALQQVETAPAAMFLASVAHLLPGDILVSNRQPVKLALNFAGAYYFLSGKC